MRFDDEYYGTENATIIIKGNIYQEILLNERPAILKLFGYSDRKLGDDDNYVVTEDQFLNYLNAINIVEVLPLNLMKKLLNDSIWFLGCSPNELKIKVILNRIFSEDRGLRSPLWFAIQSNPNVLDKAIWMRENVHLIEVSLSNYFTKLEQHMRKSQSLANLNEREN